jgi:hypothetical protein
MLVQAFKDLQRGEQTATALENHLSSLEKKIDDLLSSAETNQNTASEKAEPNKEQVESAKDESTKADKSNTTA